MNSTRFHDPSLLIAGLALGSLAHLGCISSDDIGLGNDDTGGSSASDATSGATAGSGGGSTVSTIASATSGQPSSTGSGGADVTTGAGGMGGNTMCSQLGAAIDLAVGQDSVKEIAVDATHVYWTTNAVSPGQAGAIHRVSQAGGPVETIASLDQFPNVGAAFNGPDGIAVSATNVYWRAARGNDVWTIALQGGTPEPLFLQAVSFDSFQLAPQPWGRPLVLGGASVFWTRSAWVSPGNSWQTSVHSMPVAGGVAFTLASYPPSSGIEGGGSIAGAIGLDSTELYWAAWDSEMTSGDTTMAELDGAGSAPIGARAMGIASDGANVFTTFEGFVARYDKTSGTSSMIDEDGPDQFHTNYDIVLNQDKAYVGNAIMVPIELQGCGQILEVDQAGAGSQVLWSGEGRPHSLAIANGTLFWSDLEVGAIRKMTLP
jgi:hypothetical protein